MNYEVVLKSILKYKLKERKYVGRRVQSDSDCTLKTGMSDSMCFGPVEVQANFGGHRMTWK